MQKHFLIFLRGVYDWPTPGNDQHLVHYLSKHGKVICFEHPMLGNLIGLITNKKPFIEKISTNITILHAFSLFPKSQSFSPVNKINYLFNYKILSLSEKTADRKGVTIISFTPEAALLGKYFRGKDTIYYVVDNYLSYPVWENKKQYFNYLENQFLKLCNKVIVSSIPLFKKYKRKHPNVYYFPNPARCSPFFNYFNKKSQVHSGNLLSINKPIIGFVGDLEKYRIDFQLIKKAAIKYQNYSFVLIGPVGLAEKSTKRYLSKANNIYYLGYKKFEELPKYIKEFDVCIIPYKLNSYGRMCFPIKTFEYLALGKPVVTTALLTIKHLADKGIIYWSKNAHEFIRNIEIALKEKNKSYFERRRVQEAEKNDWNIRIKELLPLLNEK